MRFIACWWRSPIDRIVISAGQCVRAYGASGQWGFWAMDIVERGEQARSWLLEHAFPLWLERGLDNRNGGWFDKLDQSGAPLPGVKRSRVQARQIFVYAQARRLGWSGDWRHAISAGLDFLMTHLRRDDGFFRVSVDVAGLPVNTSADLYDQAFVLFALASAYDALDRPPALRAEAEALLGALCTRLAHPIAGFEEAVPRVLPLRSNPHMHLLEAMLAWMDAGVAGPFEAVARSIVALATDRLIDPQTGAIGEYYDGDWAFATDDGHIREPGHQFEWAYLLHECGLRMGANHDVAISRLVAFAESHGVIEGRTIFSVDEAGAAIDLRARLWATTERLRTMTVLAHAQVLDDAGRTQALRAAHDSADVLSRFLAVPVAGLWSDWLDTDGVLVVEPVPSSSLYHIVTGLVPMIELCSATPTPMEYPA